jgi:hypothetical protein
LAVLSVPCFRHQIDTDHSAKKVRGDEFRDCMHIFGLFFFVFRPEAAGDERPVSALESELPSGRGRRHYHSF